MPTKVENNLRKLLKFDTNTLVRQEVETSLLVGIDEVGRGCLAGPVVAAAVIFPRLAPRSAAANALKSLNDSKLLTPEKRESISQTLREHCKFAIGQASVEEIDSINILQATFLAMRRAVEQLAPPENCLIIIDGNKSIPHCAYRQFPVIKGDSLSAAIAAASVIAKVHRDRMMSELARTYPAYKWDSNKGYGSKDHRNAIAEFGLTALHRKKFCEGLAELAPKQLTLANM